MGLAGADTQPAIASDFALAETGIASRAALVVPAAIPAESFAETRLAEPPATAKTAARDPSIPSPESTSDEIPVGTTIGYWTVTRKLGEGGMGAVYAATAAEIGTTVAVKVLSFPGWRSPGARPHFEKAKERFRREAESASKLKHPNVIAILAYGNLPDGRPYFVMEYLPGRSLDVRLQDDPPLGSELLRLLSQVCDALAAIHLEGIVHRDLKPENVWVVEPKQGETFAKLLDFGISKMEGASKLTETGMHAGTPFYESPEQLDNKNIGPHSDIYSFGAVLYQILTGEPLWGGQSVAKIFHDILYEEPPPMVARAPYTVTPALERLVRDCLRKKPDQRPQSALELKARLQVALGDPSAAVAAPVVVTPPSPIGTRPQAGLTVHESVVATADMAARVTGHGRLVAKALVGLVLVAVAVGLFLALRRPAAPATPAAPMAAPHPSMPASPPTEASPSPPPAVADKPPSSAPPPDSIPPRRGAIRRVPGAKSSGQEPSPAKAESPQVVPELAPPPAPSAPPAQAPAAATPVGAAWPSAPSAEPTPSARGRHHPMLPRKPELIYKDLREEK